MWREDVAFLVYISFFNVFERGSLFLLVLVFTRLTLTFPNLTGFEVLRCGHREWSVSYFLLQLLQPNRSLRAIRHSEHDECRSTSSFVFILVSAGAPDLV